MKRPPQIICFLVFTSVFFFVAETTVLDSKIYAECNRSTSTNSHLTNKRPIVLIRFGTVRDRTNPSAILLRAADLAYIYSVLPELVRLIYFGNTRPSVTVNGIRLYSISFGHYVRQPKTQSVFPVRALRSDRGI